MFREARYGLDRAPARIVTFTVCPPRSSAIGRGVALDVMPRIVRMSDTELTALLPTETMRSSWRMPAAGQPCRRQTIGLLERRNVRVSELHFIGKESNRLEEVEEGSIHDLQTVYTEYHCARRERKYWLQRVVPKLKLMEFAELERLTGLSPATLKAARGGRLPRPKNRATILAALRV